MCQPADGPELARPGRREFLATVFSSIAAAQALAGCGPKGDETSTTGRFATRGVVLVPEDFTLADWPERAAGAGLTTIALHHPTSVQSVIAFIQSGPGQSFLEKCGELHLHVEYELHAMRELLPRQLFEKVPDLFRMDDSGQRVADANCCVHNAATIETICGNALNVASVLRPTTGRHFFWGDDGAPWCRCSKCRTYSDSEQALILENALVTALRKLDRRAQVAHLAYQNTLPPPAQVKPEPGVFLEFAPIKRRYDVPYANQSGPDTDFGLESLDANLRVFPPDTAQVLEYWLDVSRFSGWKRENLTRIPWDDSVYRADLADYERRGIRHITSFAAWIDAEYVRRFGEPPLSAYATPLK